MVSAAPVSRQRPLLPRPRRLIARLTPAEGWTVLLLHAIVLLIAAWTLQWANWAPARGDIALLTLGGLFVGLVLSKLHVPDFIAHACSVAIGLAVSIWTSFDRLAEVAPGRREQLRFLWDQALAWYRDRLGADSAEEQQITLVVMGVTIWLIAYMSAWVLFRHGWLTTALAIPGAVALMNLGATPEAGTWPLFVALGAACVLAARHHLYRREREWARTRTPRPTRLPWRFLGAGVNLALVTVILGWTLPLSARSTVVEAVRDRFDAPVAALEERWQDWFGDFARNSRSPRATYAAFGEAFRLGGRLNLSDDPVMLLRPDSPGVPRPMYLAGHRYGSYDGHGWKTDVAETFQPTNADGTRYQSQMSFAAGQAIYLSPDDLTAPSEVKATVTVLRPKGDLLFAPYTFLAVDRKADVQLSWRQLRDEAYDLQNREMLQDLPVDLRQFASLLRQGQFPPPVAGEVDDSPMPLDAALAAELDTGRATLSKRFLDVRWETAADGRVTTLIVNGQLPVYDDVEAVFSQEAVAAGQSYRVTSLASYAEPAALRQAATAYPPYIENRYLALPETVTPRTRQLTAEIASSYNNPFDVAVAIQDHVRQRITYDEEISAPPSDQDVVDYVLFDSQRGYCEYYASAMAVMLRTRGIPSRVVGGYFPPPFDAAQNGFLYREESAHLWVEAYFPGYGWIPFEPTASQQPFAYGDLTPPDAPVTTPEAEATAEAAPIATPAVPPPAAADPAANDPSLIDRLPAPLAWSVLAFGSLIVAAIVVGGLIWLWRFRGLSATGGSYARAIRAGRWLGIRATPTMTPDEYAERLGHAVPAALAPARAVADLYSEELYAGREPMPTAARSARAAWIALRRVLLRALVRRRTGIKGIERG